MSTETEGCHKCLIDTFSQSGVNIVLYVAKNVKLI